jgi:hypothetical protein
MLRAIKAEDLDRVCQFTAQIFCSYEPMCIALKPTVPQFVQQFTPILAACCASGLSFMIETAAGDEDDDISSSILSVSLALPFSTYNTVELTDLPVFAPVLAVFDALAHPCEQDPGAVLNFIWATHDR